MNTDEELSSEHSIHVHSLPDHILLDVFAQLDFVDLCMCSRVCLRWHSLAKDFTLKKKIVIKTQLRSTQFSSLVQHHFTHLLEEFQLLKPSGRTTLMPVKKSTLWKICKKSNNMEKLVLMCCSLSSVSLHNLPSNLVHLSIRGSEIYPDLFFSKPQLSAVPPLVCLDIGGVSNFLTSQDLYVLTNLKSLRALYLEGCFRINNGGIESIVSLLPQLLVLDVEGTDISNEGAITILNHCLNIRDLYLGHTAIDDGALLCVEPHVVPYLASLCVRNTNVTSSVLDFFLRDHLNTHTEKSDVNCFGPTDSWQITSLDNEFTGYECQHYLSHEVYGLD